MWSFIIGFILLGWLIFRIEKNFNNSIKILEDRINQQQHYIHKLYNEIQDLKNK